jgi:hypothetical protein
VRDTLDPQWYVLRVLPQKEYWAAELLRKQGYVTYVPTEVRAHKRASYSRGKAEFAVPILPGLVFAGFPQDPVWYDVTRNPLLIGPISLTSDGEPTRISILRLLEFFSGVPDGCLVREGRLRLIHIPGRSPVRSLDTRVKTISARRREEAAKRTRKANNASPVQRPPARYADFLSRFVHGGQLT